MTHGGVSSDTPEGAPIASFKSAHGTGSGAGGVTPAHEARGGDDGGSYGGGRGEAWDLPRGSRGPSLADTDLAAPDGKYADDADADGGADAGASSAAAAAAASGADGGHADGGSAPAPGTMDLWGDILSEPTPVRAYELAMVGDKLYSRGPLPPPQKALHSFLQRFSAADDDKQSSWFARAMVMLEKLWVDHDVPVT